ncbi:MAG TPA: phosphoenolpyruvate carboxykinase [Stellaceae bacterium]|nr:phosphoenolpyruvate carboxykinase [Stellaceae bacterium]
MDGTPREVGLKSSLSLEEQGFRRLAAVHWNLSVPLLYEHAIRRHEGEIAAGGAFVAVTGVHTGRTPRDKFIVADAATEHEVDWNTINQRVSPAVFESLKHRMLAHFQGHEAFVTDCFAGADPDYRLNVRLVSDSAWHSLFTRNMFLRPTASELKSFRPAFTIIHAPYFEATPMLDKLNSEVFILVNFTERLVLIGGTRYAGEIKKSVFGLLNFLLPPRDVLPMHGSVNVGPKGDSAVFFGLSGTGKTTLSADGTRTLIGDDEHGWGAKGLFNFEGGCYAKAIRLSAEAEPEIYAATLRFGTVLENVVLDPVTRVPDFDDDSLTENTRACYPIDFIPNVNLAGMTGHPANVIMLTADAFGVLPPISRLTPDQAAYHFLSGYTARVAGTERGMGNAPQATFSTCFGAPFMPRHPTTYSKLLGDRIRQHKTECWLVNTGWSGGAYGVGQRMKIQHTRTLVRAALAGDLKGVPTRRDPFFGLNVPQSCPGVPPEVLNPRDTWSDKNAYDDTARELTKRFEQNFKRFESHVGADVKAAGIHAA